MKKNGTFKKTDFLINKTMGIFGLVIIAEILLTILSKTANTFGGYIALIKSPVYFFIVGAVILVCSILWLSRKTSAEKSCKYFGAVDLFVLSLIVLFCGLAFLLFDPIEAIRILYIFFPGCAVLYLVFSLMQRAFFVQAVFGAISLVLLLASLMASQTRSVIILIVGLVITVLFALFIFFLRGKNGTVALGKNKIAVLDAKTEYGAIFITAAAAFVVFAASLIFKLAVVGFGTILIYVLAAYFLLLAVYYIIKLM